MIIEFNNKYRKKINKVLYSSTIWKLDEVVIKKYKLKIFDKVCKLWNDGFLTYNPFNNILYGTEWQDIVNYFHRRLNRL